MKIIKDNKEIEIIIITYFKLNDDDKYLIYTIPQDTKEKILSLARIQDLNNIQKLVLPNKEELTYLKELISNFLSDRIDLNKLYDNEYEYIDIKELEKKIIEEEKSQKIILPIEKYLKFISNKYLTFPELKILNIKEIMKEGYDKNNEEAINICIFLLIIYFILVMILQIILMFLGLGKLALFTLSGPTIILWTLVIALISMVAYNFEEKSPVESWLTCFMIIAMFLILLNLILGNLIIPVVTLMSLIYSIIFIVPYVIAKKISFKIIKRINESERKNKLKARNYLTYFCIYLIPFASIFLIITKLYNNALSNFISQIIEKF